MDRSCPCIISGFIFVPIFTKLSWFIKISEIEFSSHRLAYREHNKKGCVHYRLREDNI
jgi:hypothetical protein